MKEKRIKNLDKETREHLEKIFANDWKLKCDPKWRKTCGIEDEKMIEMIRKIFIIIDTSWDDYPAQIISLLINDYIENKQLD